MALLVIAVLILAMTGHSMVDAAWCVCKDGPDAMLQKTLDYACGAGAECGPIHQNGVCFNPNTVRAHCNYAVNSYFQKKNQAPGSCDFAGTAIVSASDPSYSGCAYPASASAAGTPITTTTPSTTTNPSTTNPTNGVTPTNTSPFSSTPTGVLGGVGSGLGPSGINTDYSACIRLQVSILLSILTALLFSASMLSWS